MILDQTVAGIPQVRSAAVDFFLSLFWYVMVIHKYSNFATFSKDLLHVFMYCDFVLRAVQGTETYFVLRAVHGTETYFVLRAVHGTETYFLLS